MSKKSRPKTNSAPKNAPPIARPSKRLLSVVLVSIALLVVAGFAGVWAGAQGTSRRQSPAAEGPPIGTSKATKRGGNVPPIPASNPLDAQRAYGYLNDICSIGRRVSGTLGMKRQQELLVKHFESLGGKVTRQEFMAKNPLGGEVPMVNLIVSWHEERKDRVLLCAHYDTRPLPDEEIDPIKRTRGVFIGANDGGSGVAVMMELAHHMRQIESNMGVDFVLFDGEELVYNGDRDPYFLGSEHFAGQHRDNPPGHKYHWGVLLDMVGDADLQVFQERNSVMWPETRPLVNHIWGLAQRMRVREFIAQPKYLIRDDHLALRNVAKIPTCDIIDFDYPYWHTEGDTPDKCSGESLAKVGWVVFEWMKRAE
jgi:glutaminyl-peptide cyclotransferase